MTKFENNLIKSIKSMDEKVKKEKWKFTYDKDSDILYFTATDKKTSKDSVLMPLSDDYISLRISTSGDIESIVVEDFKGLFLDQCPEYEPLLKTTQEKKKEIKNFRLYYRSLFSGSCLVPREICSVVA